MSWNMRYRMAVALTGFACLAASPQAHAITLGGDFAADYSFASLGTPTGVPANLGGVAFLDNDTLLIGGSANNLNAGIYQIDVVRDGNNHITGFNGAATLFATAPGIGFGGIDGGLAFGPGGVLFYTSYSDNSLGQILPGSGGPDKQIALTPEGIGASVGTLAFVPAGFAGAGSLKVASYNTGQWYTVGLTPDGGGTFDVSSATLEVTLAGGPEGIVYVDAANAAFGADSVLVSEYISGRISAYDIDGNGDPVLASRRDFLTDLSGAEGAVIDPLTGDFLFSTFGGGNQLIVVQGFVVPTQDPPPTGDVPAPGGVAFLLLGLAAMAQARRNRA